jgi:hypothetical protein
VALNVTRPSRFKSYGTHAVLDATNYTLYTCPPNTVAYMSLVFLSNGTANASDVAVVWNDDDNGTPITVIGAKNLASGEYLQLSGSFLVLEENDTVVLTADNTAGGNDPDIGGIVTVEEVFLPNG